MDYLSFTDKKRTNTIQIEKCGDLVDPDSVDNLDKVRGWGYMAILYKLLFNTKLGKICGVDPNWLGWSN